MPPKQSFEILLVYTMVKPKMQWTCLSASMVVCLWHPKLNEKTVKYMDFN